MTIKEALAEAGSGISWLLDIVANATLMQALGAVVLAVVVGIVLAEFDNLF
jgi:hypothetical protein